MEKTSYFSLLVIQMLMECSPSFLDLLTYNNTSFYSPQKDIQKVYSKPLY